MNLAQLEAAAIRTQQAAGRAWTDLMNAPASQKAEMQANYDAAQDAQADAYDAWKAAGGSVA
jgi:DnaJ-domain-containing protein 1